MESIDLRSLNLTIEESRDIINFIAQLYRRKIIVNYKAKSKT